MNTVLPPVYKAWTEFSTRAGLHWTRGRKRSGVLAENKKRGRKLSEYHIPTHPENAPQSLGFFFSREGEWNESIIRRRLSSCGVNGRRRRRFCSRVFTYNNNTRTSDFETTVNVHGRINWIERCRRNIGNRVYWKLNGGRRGEGLDIYILLLIRVYIIIYMCVKIIIILLLSSSVAVKYLVVLYYDIHYIMLCVMEHKRTLLIHISTHWTGLVFR